MSSLKTINELQRVVKRDLVAKNLVESWIKMLKDAGYSYDEMIIIFRKAKIKADCLIAKAQL